MTIIKQKGVSSDRHAKNVRKYINGKHALLRDSQNIKYNKFWFANMARTRKHFGHNIPSRPGVKNVIMLHQILAFLPEECSCNGGKMTPEACMKYAKQWLNEYYPNQQVVLALHQEHSKAGDRFAVHMAMNRSDLVTGKRLLCGGRGSGAKRASQVRKLDREWGLQQVEKDKPNSKIRPRQPRDEEKEIISRGEYSYKHNLRQQFATALEYRPKNLSELSKLLSEWGFELFTKNNKIYATDQDIKKTGNPKCTFSLSRLDGRFALKQLQNTFVENANQTVNQESKPLTYSERREVYFQRLKRAYSAYVEKVHESEGTPYDSFPKFVAPRPADDLAEDAAVRDEILARLGYADELRNRYASGVPMPADDKVRSASHATAQTEQPNVIQSGRFQSRDEHSEEHD